MMPWLSRGLLRLDDRRHDVRPSVGAVLLIACLVPLGPLLDDANLAHWQPAWLWGIAAGGLLSAPALRAGWAAGQPWRWVVLSALEGLVVMQRGWDRQNQGDEDTALALFRQAATLGLVDEDLGLALRQEAHILIGRGQPAQALALLDRSLQADPGQRRSLGLRGHALERLQRQPEARAAYEQAAQRGDTWSQLRLGRMHLQGEGVPVNRGQAAHWLTQAAQSGDKEAKQLLRRRPDLAASAASKP